MDAWGWAVANPLAALVAFACAALFTWQLLSLRRPGGIYAAPETSDPVPSQVGQITLEQLEGYDGRDVTKPILLAVRGKVFDVSKGRDFYGPGGGYNLFAGHECSRALAKMSLKPEDLSGDLGGVSEDQLGYLRDWEAKFSDKYSVVGSICETSSMTAEELSRHDGRDSSRPILLSIRGHIFDVTKGADFYGPDGAYPFAGKEVARALAKTSLDPKDFTSELEGLSQTELGTLKEWERKFQGKYKMVGRLTAS